MTLENSRVFGCNSVAILRQVLVAGLFLIVVSSVFGGPLGLVGRGERHVLLIGIFISSVFILWQRFDSVSLLIRNEKLFFAPPVLFFLINLLWVFPFNGRGHDWLLLAFADSQSLVLLPLTVLIYCCLSNSNHLLYRFGCFAVISCALLAFLQSGIWVYLKFYSLSPEQIYYYVELIFETKDSIFILEQPSNSGNYIRVVWISSYWLVFAVFLTPLFIKSNILIFLMQSMLTLAIIASYTRGIWLGLVIGIVVFIMAMILFSMRSGHAVNFARWRWSLWGIGVAFVFVILTDHLRGDSYAILSRLYIDDPATSYVVPDESVVERRLQTTMLLEKWRERPLLGHGYGAYVETHFSHPERPFLYEMVPVALLMKLGIVGFGIYLLSLLFLVLRMGKLAMRSESGVALLAATVAYLIQVHTNPVFFSFTGMLIFSLLIYFWLALETNGGHTLSNTHASTAI